MQKLWRGSAYFLNPQGLLSLIFIKFRTTSPGMASPTVEWSLHQSAKKKILHMLAYRLILLKHILNCGSFFLMNLACVKLT